MLSFSAPLWPPSAVHVSYEHVVVVVVVVVVGFVVVVVVVVVVVAAAAVVVLHAFHVVAPLSFDNLDALLDSD